MRICFDYPFEKFRFDERIEVKSIVDNGLISTIELLDKTQIQIPNNKFHVIHYKYAYDIEPEGMAMVSEDGKNWFLAGYHRGIRQPEDSFEDGIFCGSKEEVLEELKQIFEYDINAYLVKIKN